jgi:hypothetical protein
VTTLDDRELLEVFADRPQLLALADAIRETQRRPRRRGRLLPALAAALAAVGALALGVSWPAHGPNSLERALAAVGDGPVVHAVVESASPSDVLVRIATGRERPRAYRAEYWYDAARHELHTRLFADGVQMSEIVETPDRTDSDLGRSPTGGGSAPALDPGLAGFATHYREALASGSATIVDRTTLDLVLQFGLPGGSLEIVTVDAATYEPLTFRYIARARERPSRFLGEPGSPVLASVFTEPRSVSVAPQPVSPEWRVLEIQSLPRDPAFFEAPRLAPPRPTAGSAGLPQRATLDEARRALGGAVYWLGPTFLGSGLDSVELARATAELTDGRELAGAVVRLRYGGVVVSEAVDSAAAYQLGFGDGGPPPPPDGYLEQSAAGTATLERGGVAIQLEAPDEATLLAAARALTRT